MRFAESVWWLLLTWEFLIPKVLEMDTLRPTLRICHLEWGLGTGYNWVHLQSGVQYRTLTDQVLERSALWEQKRSLEGTEKLRASPFQTEKPLSFCSIIKIRHVPCHMVQILKTHQNKEQVPYSDC